MDTIVVGFDGSTASFVALDWVGERAARLPSRVELVRVDHGDALAGEFEAYAFDKGMSRLRNLAPDAEVSHRTVAGRMPQALVKAAAGADLLVIGTHHHRPVRSALTGWRPLRTITQSPVAVVVVPDDWQPGDGPVVVGVDDDASSAAALDFAARHADAVDTGVTLVHAWQMPVPTMEGPVALLSSPVEVKRAHRRLLDDAGAALGGTHPGIRIESLLVQDNPAAALLNALPRPSLIVIGTHRRGRAEGMFLGSVTQDVIPLSRVPVCVVPTIPPSS